MPPKGARSRTSTTGHLLGRIDHNPQEVLYGLLGVIGETRMDGRRLDHGAAGRDEPSEALALRQHPHCASLSSAFAHPAHDLEVCQYGLGIEVGVECLQTFRVEADARVEELRVLAVEHHPCVYEFTALDARHHAQECVLEKAHRLVSSSALTHALGSCRRVLR